jgi:hypothetical protein
MTTETSCPTNENTDFDNADHIAGSIAAAQQIYNDQTADARITRKFELIFMATDIATTLRPDVTAYDDEFDFRACATGILPAIADVAVSTRNRVLISAPIAGEMPTAAEVRLIAAALEMMEKD